ncbi:hypothetical protein O3M35_007007 [Rhynocoris fuscipes]|uniref:Invertebrate defensins family profile domain-containing protein n=1 Tax=Rhynocoris fuscipes TaxID=488301 RepID=A0AAW1DMR3_9HEMI
MKCALVFVNLFMLAAFAYSYPNFAEKSQQLDDALWTPAAIEVTEGHLMRQKRFTCDVLKNAFNVCYLHCAARGFRRGGACIRNVCHCRKP